jgi:Na+-translocating ferredoxin:NAD+ oxidoreductase RNF subunit RnfB
MKRGNYPHTLHLIWIKPGGENLSKNVYLELASYLSMVYLGWLSNIEDLVKLLQLSFTPEEARALLSVPAKPVPVELTSISEIAATASMPEKELEPILDRLAERGFLYTGEMENGEKGYALLRRGYGFTQAWFWAGKRDALTKKFVDIYWKYHFPDKGDVSPQNFRYIPINISIESLQPEQAIYPHEMIVEIVRKARKIAVAHCACRVRYELANGEHCGHPEEVCIKFNELAEQLIRAGLAREVSKEEALDIIRKTEEAGLVHFTDNTQEGILHNCNCCGCACWNLGAIKRRMVPRDQIIATYFLRETDEELCTACGSCVDICPVDAVSLDDIAVVDEDWCVGCGLCIAQCSSEAITLKRRSDAVPPETFESLHRERERAYEAIRVRTRER